MSSMNDIFLCCLILVLCLFSTAVPAHAFTADSLDITVNKNGDAIATFRYTLEGVIENSIPQSVLEGELIKGLATGPEPPELLSMDRSSAVLLMKQFADTSDVPTGTEYRTESMDFTKAEAALKSSALSGVVSADFSPASVILTFPDSYERQFSNVDVLPSVTHTVVDPSKTPRPSASRTESSPATSTGKGSLNVTSMPMNVMVYLDSRYIGESPSVFPDIDSGTYIAQFEKEGYEPVSKDVTILDGRTTNVMVVLALIQPVTPGEISPFVMFIWPAVIIALIAVAVCGYYFRQRKKTKGMADDNRDYVKE